MERLRWNKDRQEDKGYIGTRCVYRTILYIYSFIIQEKSFSSSNVSADYGYRQLCRSDYSTMCVYNIQYIYVYTYKSVRSIYRPMSFSFILFHSLSLSLSLSLSTHTHTHTFSLSLSLSLSHTFSLPLFLLLSLCYQVETVFWSFSFRPYSFLFFYSFFLFVFLSFDIYLRVSSSLLFLLLK